MGSKSVQIEKLCNLTTKIGSGATPRGGKESYLDKGPYALIRSQNVLDFFFSEQGLAYINEEQAAKLSNVELQENDVLINITGDSVARVCQVPSEFLPARVNQHVAIVRCDEKKLDSTYLKYYLLNPKFKNYMLSLASVGGTRNALTKGMLEDFDVELPDLATQKRIASILSAFDEKIELNRQTNETLEAIAQAIYKEWFVNFNFPGATEEMQDSELGPIPQGWRVVPIGALFEMVIGGDWGKEECLSSHDICCAVIRGTDLPGISVGEIAKVPRRYIKRTNFQKRELCEGDIVFEISGGSKGQATGRNLIMTKESLALLQGKAIPASFCRLIRAKDLNHAVFLSTYLRILYDDGGTWDYQLQSTGISNFQFSDFANRKKLIIPTDQVMEQYSKLVLPLYKKMGRNNLDSYYLVQTRDGLLPKLMNGEVEA